MTLQTSRLDLANKASRASGCVDGPARRSRIRSLLWVGNTTGEAVRAALKSSEADLIVTDLEDTVAPRRKHEVRELLRALIAERSHDVSRRPLFVRTNPLDEPQGAADLIVLREAGVDGLVVPKATPEVLERAYGAGVQRLVALVETAAGVERAGESASCLGVELVELGAMDLALELRIEPTLDGIEMVYTRSRLVMASRAAGLPGPVDAIFANVNDLDGYREKALRARMMGFGGMPCLTEEQVEVANAVFTSSEKEIDRARRIVQAFDAAIERGEGVVDVDGIVVERPTAERARLVLHDAGIAS